MFDQHCLIHRNFGSNFVCDKNLVGIFSNSMHSSFEILDKEGAINFMGTR